MISWPYSIAPPAIRVTKPTVEQPVSTQLPCEASISVGDEGLRSSQFTLVGELIRSALYISKQLELMHLATMTGPNIAYATHVLAHFNCNPEMAYWKPVKHVFR